MATKWSWCCYQVVVDNSNDSQGFGGIPGTEWFASGMALGEDGEAALRRDRGRAVVGIEAPIIQIHASLGITDHHLFQGAPKKRLEIIHTSIVLPELFLERGPGNKGGGAGMDAVQAL